MEFAVSSGDGPGPHSSAHRGRPFPSFGVLSTVDAPTLSFPKQDNERDPDLAIWDEVRRGWLHCGTGTEWSAKESKACYRGAIRHSIFCNGFTDSGQPDRTGKLDADNWKVLHTFP